MHRRFTRVASATMAAILLLQSTPGGMLAAYAANNGISVSPREDSLKEELAAKAEDYPAGAIAFYESGFTASEGDGDREVKVVRWGDTSLEATVDIKVFALTATYGEDFEVYTKRGIAKDVLDEEPLEADVNQDEGREGEKAGEDATDASADAPVEEGERVPFEATDPAAIETTEGSESSETTEDGISSMREAYAVQTGKDTKRTDWRGEYEESIAPVAAVDAANELAGELPGASGTLTFEPGEYVKSVYVSVKDDDLAEGKEAFKLVLGNVSAGVVGEQLQCNVAIEDNEEGEPIAFAMRDAQVTVGQGAEYAELAVLRASGENYYAGAVISTAADTATPEVSYEAMDGVVVPFASGSTEQVVRIPLKEGAQPGTQFTVRLDSDAVNVDGLSETVVKIEDRDPDDAAAQEGEGIQGPSVPAVEFERGSSDKEGRSVTRVIEHDGVQYECETVRPWKSASADGSDKSASFTYTCTALSREAARIIAKIDVWGSTDHWIFGNPGYKNWSMSFGGRGLISERDCDSNKLQSYTEQFNINYNEGASGGLWLKVNTDGTNYNGRIRLNEITYCYPKYTIHMNASDYEQTFQSRNYTSVSEYKESTVSALPDWNENRTTTFGRYGFVDLAPTGDVLPGLEIEKYEMYAGDVKVGEFTSPIVTYSQLNELRKNNDDALRNSKFTLRAKPVYKKMATTVKFTSQDASAIGFSGDKKGGTGFKTGDVLKATQIDTVTVTAECPTDQKIKPSAINHYSGTKLSQSYKADGSLTFKVEKAPLWTSEQTFQVLHADVSLTYEYTPSEAGAVNAGVGAISVYNASDFERPLGVSNYKEPLTLRDSLEMVAGNNYVARVIKGDGFQEGTIVDGIPYSTRTIWTYTDPETGRKVSTTGNAFMFDPYYGDEVVNYHFKSTQDDAEKAGVTGTVYIEEKPLFSSNAAQTSKPAVGVKLDVGGENTQTDQSGKYTIAPKFNKSDYVAAFLTYDSLTMMDNVALSEDTVKDFHIKVDEADALKVTGSSFTKLTNTNEFDMENDYIYEEREAHSVLLEDAQYTFYVSASGSAGVIPAKAEFYFYDKNGNRKEGKTQTANFEGGTATLKMNPQSLNLSVGDSMTVKLFDAKGNGYFEHQTSVVIGEKIEGLYTFNYEGIKSEDDNLFLKALGGISMGYDFALDALSANAGTYEDESGAQHQLMFMGFGDGFQNKGSNAETEVYNTLQEAIANIDEVNTGAYSLNSNDNIAFFGNGNWTFDVKLGIIYDMVMEDSGDRKGEFKFSDYLMLVDASALYNREWKVPAGPVNLTFGLQFGMGDPGNGTSGVSVKWHFYDPDDQGYFVKDDAAINLLADENIDSTGYFGFDARVLGSLRAEFLGDLIGGEGALTVQLGNRVGYDSQEWNDFGEILLSPKVKLVVLGIGIPVWTETWRYEWDTKDGKATSEASSQMMRAIDEGMSPGNVLFTSTDEGVQEDYSYTEGRSGWNGGGGFDFFGLARKTEGTQETVLQQQFLADSDIAMYDLGEGKYIAAFLDVVPGRDDANKMGAYYTVYDGSAWSEPVLLDNDGTEDQAPTISDAGRKGALITWSSAGSKLEEGDDLTARLSSLDIKGTFYSDGELGDVMEITHETGKDQYGDANPRAVCYEKDGKEYIKLYYTKSEFKVSDPKEGEVVGDLLNPDQLNLTREYDVTEGKWIDTYDEKTAKGIREMLKGQLIKDGNPNPTEEQIQAAYEQYCAGWYGQVLLDLAPAVEIEEQLDENGRWAADPVITPLDDKVASSRIVRDSDAIAYNGLGLLAYSLDKGGMAQQTEDQNLYLQIFNSADNEYHHPIMISGVDAEISDIQFVRSTYRGKDGKDHELTWLYWKEQATEVVKDEHGDSVLDEEKVPVTQSVTSIKRLDISTLVGNRDDNLLKKVVGDQTFYCINKAEGNGKYAPEQTLVKSTPEADDGNEFSTIGNFQVKSSFDGRYNYIAWTQPVTAGEGDAMRQGHQLFAVREDLSTGEISAPVQLTDGADRHLTDFDLAVTEDGAIDVLSGRQTLAEQSILDENGNDTGAKQYLPDPATSELVFMHLAPLDEVTIGDATEGELRKSDGKASIDLSTKIKNEGFENVEKVNIEAIDANGKVVYSSEDEELFTYEDVSSVEQAGGGVTFEGGTEVIQKRGLIDLGGGSTFELPFCVPVDDAGAYDVTLRVTADGKEIASKRLSGQVPVKLTSTELGVEVVERDKVKLSATLSNDTVLASPERDVAYGYLDADGNKIELGTERVDAVKPGDSIGFSVAIDQDFSEFESRTLEDGSLVDGRTYYLDLEPSGDQARSGDAPAGTGVIQEGENTATTVFGSVELTAYASQVALMSKVEKFGAVVAKDDGEGGIKAVDAVSPGEYAQAALTVNGALAQDSEEFINGFKVIWDALDTDVATMDETGLLHVKKEGDVRLTGKVMPADTAVLLGAQATSETIDNYDALPASLIRPIEVTLHVGTNGGSGDVGGGSNPGGTGTDGLLPNMGDLFNPVYLMIMVVTGAALVATGTYLRRKSKRKE